MLALAVFGSWYFVKRRQHKKQLQQLLLKKQDIETKLSLLSGQLNPHFLFNSLHAIQGTINSNNITEANNYINRVALFMRNIMDYGKKEFISLQEELDLETDYLQLEQKRKTISFTVEVENQINASQIDFPPLLLQPVLENSVRHAFGYSKGPKLTINVFAKEKDLVINISDNGAGWNTAERKEGHGLGLVRKRIELINEKTENMSVQMHITSVLGIGTTTIFTCKNWLA